MKLVILRKGKKMPIGTVSHGRKKIAEGKWVPHTEGKKGVKSFKGVTDDGKQVTVSQDESGMYSGEIRDELGSVESTTIKKTQNEVMKWLGEHEVKSIDWKDTKEEATKPESQESKVGSDSPLTSAVKDRADELITGSIVDAKQAASEAGESDWKDWYEVPDIADDVMEALADEGLLPEDEDAEAELADAVLTYVKEKWDEG